jgi:hypothetical protein
MFRNNFHKAVVGRVAFCTWLISAAVANTASARTLDTIKIDSHESLSSNLAIVVQPQAWKIGHNRAQGGIEFGYGHQYGAGDQTLATNHYVSYGAENQPTYHTLELNGPQLRNKVKFDHLHLAYDCLISFGDHFQLEPSLGASHDSIKLESTSAAPTGRITSSVDQYGVYAGLAPRWVFNNFVAVEARIKGSLALNNNLSSSSTLIVNPALVLRPIKTVAISIGGASRDQYFNGGLFDFEGSDVDMGLSGVSVGLRASF